MTGLRIIKLPSWKEYGGRFGSKKLFPEAILHKIFESNSNSCELAHYGKSFRFHFGSETWA